METDSQAIQMVRRGAVAGGLGQVLREARRQSSMSFGKFAQLAGFSESHLRSVENGHRSVTADVASAYDRVLATHGRFLAELTMRTDRGTTDGVTGPWNQASTLEAISDLLNGSEVNRRDFVAVSGPALVALAGRWNSADVSSEPPLASGSRRIRPELVSHIDERLDHLRHLDDELGSGHLVELARNELGLIVQLLRGGSYTERTGRLLYSLAAEASRQAAWAAFDQHHHATARWYFETALRASATAGDRVAGAYALSFAAIQCYSTGQPQHALSLLETARSSVKEVATPRMRAMLAARSARAHSKGGDRRACAHMLYEARVALDQGPRTDDPAVLYWVTEGEIEMIAGSSVLELGDPAEAARRFEAANRSRDDGYPRSQAIYLARAAEAHLALHDLDAAVDRARRAMHCLGGVDSARSTTTLAGLRAKLAAHAKAPVVRDFLDETR